MLRRRHRHLLLDQLDRFPAAAVLGPRQCGKTTLAQSLKGRYFDLEQAGERVRLDAEWDEAVRSDELIVLDEAHEAPDVFPRLRGAIDADRKRNGRFLVLGSVSPSLMRTVSESLAGRLAIIELSPFVLSEVGTDRVDDLWLYGGYPDGGILDSLMFGRWQTSYLSLIIERDLPAWGLPAKPRTTERLVRMLAALQGQQMNSSQLASSLTLDSKTVVSYCDYLEGAYLIRRLAPYHANLKKRLVKSPRIIWRDSGLFHSLVGVRDRDQLFSQPWVGNGWECFVIEQTIATLRADGENPSFYYFRTRDGYEIDLVIDWGIERWAVEIKLTSAPDRDMLRRLNKTADLIDAKRRILVCRAEEPIDGDVVVTNLAGWLGELEHVSRRSGQGSDSTAR